MFYTLMLSILLGGLSRIRWGTYYIKISQPGKRMLPYVPYVTHKAVAQMFHTHKIVISFYCILGVCLWGGCNNKICVLFTKSHNSWLNNKRGLRMHSYATHMLPVCIGMYPYVTRMYPNVSYVARMLPVCYS